jgi:hypothetical protein
MQRIEGIEKISKLDLEAKIVEASKVQRALQGVIHIWPRKVGTIGTFTLNRIAD